MLDEEEEGEVEEAGESEQEEEEKKVAEILDESGNPYKVMSEGCSHYRRACKKKCE